MYSLNTTCSNKVINGFVFVAMATHFPYSRVVRVRVCDPQAAGVPGAGDGNPRLVRALLGLAVVAATGAALQVHVVRGGKVHVVRPRVDEEAAVVLRVRVAGDVNQLPRPSGSVSVVDARRVESTALKGGQISEDDITSSHYYVASFLFDTKLLVY